MAFKIEETEEDNDTSEEEDEEENCADNSNAEKYKSDLLNPKKGFKFFIEEEVKFLQRLERKKQLEIEQIKKKHSIGLAEKAVKDETKVIDLTEEENGDVDYDYDDEDFAWYTYEMRDKTYFAFVNCERRPIKKGDQAYYCYGKRSNAFLLLNYGFCIPDNKYDSLIVRVKLNVEVKDHDLTDYSVIIPALESEVEYVMSEEIRLKFD